MILIVSNARDATADFLQERMVTSDVSFFRLNTELLPQVRLRMRPSAGQLSGGFKVGERYIRLDEIGAVYYRRPIMPAVDGEFSSGLRAWMQNEYRRAWGGLLLALNRLRWVNHPLAISGASYKTEQLARAQRIGLRVPDTVVTTEPEEALEFCEQRDWNVIVKPLGHGEIRGEDGESDWLVYTNALRRELEVKLPSVAHCPTMFQKRIDKVIDIRVTVVDDRCIAVALHSQEQPISRIDCRRNNMVGMRYSLIELPTTLSDMLVTLTASYDLHFAAIDLAQDTGGDYWFFELNPGGQWAWLEQKIGAPISAALIDCLRT